MTSSPFIKSTSTLASALRRLHDLNDAMVVANKDGSFKIMVRNIPTGDENLPAADPNHSFDVGILINDKTDIRLACENAYDGYFDDDDDLYVLEDYTYTPGNPMELEAPMDFLNKLYLWRICPCGERFIKDDYPVCVACDLTDVQTVVCPVCMDPGIVGKMREAKCCKNPIHRACWDKCQAIDPRCPLCRQKK